MDTDRRSICVLTLTSDRLQSEVEDRLLISVVSGYEFVGRINPTGS
jgi:hypothetical protein